MNIVCVSGTVTWVGKLMTGKSSWIDFGLAIDKPEKTTTPTFVQVRCYGKRAETVEHAVAKRMRLMIGGNLRQSTWEKAGEKREKVYLAANSIQRLRKLADDGAGEEGDDAAQPAGEVFDAPGQADVPTPSEAAEENLPF